MKIIAKPPMKTLSLYYQNKREGKYSMDEKNYTPDEVATLFQISKHTVYELIKRGELQAFKIGNKMRIDQNELERFKESTKAPVRKKTSVHATAPLTSSHSLQLSGSHDFLVEHLIKYGLSKQIQIQPSYIGSLEGLMLLYRGQTDVAAIHLLDPSSQEYNIPFIKQLFVHEDISVIRFASREQGFITAKGNPKEICDFTDLIRNNITFVNRQKGSGTRFLFDSKISELQIVPEQINGYENEEWNHLSSASYISRGAADVTFGIQSAANHLGLEFIPVTNEQFDLVFRWTNQNKTALTKLLKILQSEPFINSLTDLEGYDITNLGKVILQNGNAEE